MVTDKPDPRAVFEGRRPTRSGDLTLETQGMAPIPVTGRYGSAPRNFFIWFGSNTNLSTFFTGTLAVTLGLGFWPAVYAVTLGLVLGAIPVAWLALFGPTTGMGILPFARLIFGKSITLPAIVQWLTTVAWDALIGIFGGAAMQSLLHVPFAIGVAIILAVQGAVGFLGYEFIHRFEKWASAVTAVFFGILAFYVLKRGDIQMQGSVHGPSAVAMFVLMVTISLSLTISWGGCASDYSRYMPRDSSRSRVFWFTLAGLVLSCEWTVLVGALAGKFLTDQTSAGVRTVVGGGIVGVFALIAIGVSAVASNAILDYSGSLALQAGGIPIKRPLAALASTVLAFGIILWIHNGQLSTRFENVLLFTGYWVAPFVAVIATDWFMSRGRVTDDVLEGLVDGKNLRSGWAAIVSFIVGFGAMVPFVDTSLVFGPVAKALDGADISYPIGILAGSLCYFSLARLTSHPGPAVASAPTVLSGSSETEAGPPM